MQSGVPTKVFTMPEGPMTDKTIVGIDVSKNWLDVASAGAAGVVRIDNTPAAIAAWLAQARPALVAFEPTGGYERTLCAALRERAILFVRVHPNDVVAFRKSRGLKAKTDSIDAGLIAAFAAEELVRRGLRPTILGDEVLRELAARRRQLADTLQAERCRAALATTSEVRASLHIVIEALAASLATIDQALATRIAADPQTAALDGLLRSIQGIGPITARTLIADLPELGHLNGKEIAALAGLAPITRQSGKTRYRERTAHGRIGVRNARTRGSGHDGFYGISAHLRHGAIQSGHLPWRFVKRCDVSTVACRGRRRWR